MIVPETDLDFEDLFSASGQEPDSLFDAWLRGGLDEATEEAVVGHILGSTFARDEALLRVAAIEAAHASVAARGAARAVRVAVRRVRDVLHVLASSLQPLPAASVATRSGESAAAGSRDFAVDAFGPGSRLNVVAGIKGRFRLSLMATDPPGETTEWVLVGERGRMVTGDPDRGEVLFRSVGPGLWNLQRREGELVRCFLEIQLENESWAARPTGRGAPPSG